MSNDNEVVIFDTETTGLPAWKKPSDDECQPHLVQVAAIQVNIETKKIIQTMDLIVKPDGWIIPDLTFEIHGITTEFATEHGFPEKEVVELFLKMVGDRKRVAYNTTFDNRLIRIAAKRFLKEGVADLWKEGEYECAMMMARKVIGGKNPKLIDAYKHFTGKDMVGAHNAMADTLAAMEVYFAIGEA